MFINSEFVREKNINFAVEKWIALKFIAKK